MLYLESFLHRVTLAEIVSRWIVDQPLHGDVQALKKIVNFNSYASRRWSDWLVTELLESFHGTNFFSWPMHTKADLKDLVVEHPLYTNLRIDEMRQRYLRFPEDFYRETPVDGRIYCNGDKSAPRFAGASRIKRYRRIAEKGSRRIAEFMFERIKRNADDLAEERARSLGIPREALVTPHEQMVEEFAHAERRLIKGIKRGTLLNEFPILTIPDAVGLKLIVEDSEYSRLVDIIKSNPRCRLLEQEQHSGAYTATNMRLAYILPKDKLRAQPPSGRYLSTLAYRGIPPASIVDEYREFIDTAEDHVMVEIIASSFQNFLESEIGSSMHEDRVVQQRSTSEYRSHLATNVRYLMNYMLTLCRAPGPPGELDEVPIKLWVHYIPDTVDHHLQRLYVKGSHFHDNLEDIVKSSPMGVLERRDFEKVCE
jgi:hypothetical protein